MKTIAGVPTGILDQHVAVLGKTRSGKSSVMRQMVESLLDAGKPVCIVDPKGDWWGIKLAADGKGPGYPVVIFGGEHADVPINEHAGAHVAELFATGNRPCLIDLGGWTVGARTKFWIDFASTLFKLTKGQRYLAVDEFHNFAPKGRVMDPDAGKMLHWSNRLASEGLGKGLNLLFASQRPQKVHNDSLTSAETLIAMRVLHPSDRGAVSDWIKGCGDGAGDDVLNSLGQMDRGEGWVWSPEIGFGPKRVKFPMFSTYDSFRPQTVEDTKRLKGWAEVDLDEVREKLGKVVEEAKANDPRELRRLLAEKDKQIRALEAEVAKPANVITSVSTPALTDADRALIEKLAGKLDEARLMAFAAVAQANVHLKTQLDAAASQHINTAREIGGGLASMIEGQLEKASVKKLLEKLNSLAVPAAATLKTADIHRMAAKVQPQYDAALRTPSTSPSRAPIAPREPKVGEVKIGKCERAILTVLSQQPDGCEAGKLVLLAGYAWSGTFSNALGALRTAGLIVGGNTETMRITDAGLEYGPFPQLPKGAALATYWLTSPRFGKAERLCLQALVDNPQGLDANGICRITGYAWSGTLSNALGALRTAGLLIGKNTEVMRASALLFDEVA